MLDKVSGVSSVSDSRSEQGVDTSLLGVANARLAQAKTPTFADDVRPQIQLLLHELMAGRKAQA